MMLSFTSNTTLESVWSWPPGSISLTLSLSFSLCVSLVLQDLTSVPTLGSFATPQALLCSQSSSQYLLRIQVSKSALILRVTCCESNPPGSSRIGFQVYQYVQAGQTSWYCVPSQLVGLVISEIHSNPESLSSIYVECLANCMAVGNLLGFRSLPGQRDHLVHLRRTAIQV